MKAHLPLMAGLASTLVWANAALAQQRNIVINGIQLTPDMISAVDQATCSTVPNGRYWLDTETGIWGYEGLPIPVGHITDGCQSFAPQNQPRRSLSERDRLLNTHDLCPECNLILP